MATLIREDRFGPYLRTGGYLFRPTPSRGMHDYPTCVNNGPFRMKSATGATVLTFVQTTTHAPGAKVPARHIGGTPYAIVGTEVCASHGESAHGDVPTQRSVWNLSTTCYRV
jgi:hypothetical protein